MDNWEFDMFALEDVTHFYPLSVLGFALIKRTDAFTKYRMDEGKLARCREKSINQLHGVMFV